MSQESSVRFRWMSRLWVIAVAMVGAGCATGSSFEGRMGVAMNSAESLCGLEDETEFGNFNHDSGSCIESAITKLEPTWVQHPAAPVVSALFQYMNVVGGKYERGEWNEKQVEYAMTSYVNRVQIQMAEKEREQRQARNAAIARGIADGLADAAATMEVQRAANAQINNFVRNLNTGINCESKPVAFGRTQIQCW